MEEGRAPAPGRETMSTADLDNSGLLQLQQDTMARQDNELEDLERSVNSTKVMMFVICTQAQACHSCRMKGDACRQRSLCKEELRSRGADWKHSHEARCGTADFS